MNEDIKKYIKKDCNITKEYIGKDKVMDVKLNDKVGEYVIKCNDDILYSKDIYLVVDNTKIEKSNKGFVIISLLAMIFSLSLLFIKSRRKK